MYITFVNPLLFPDDTFPPFIRILSGDHIPSGGQTSATAATPTADEEPYEYEYEYYDDTPQKSPFVNPHDPSHHQPELLAGNLAGHLAGLFEPPPPKKELPEDPTQPQAPQRFFPPGQIELKRFDNGFNFNFKSQKK